MTGITSQTTDVIAVHSNDHLSTDEYPKQERQHDQFQTRDSGCKVEAVSEGPIAHDTAFGTRK